MFDTWGPYTCNASNSAGIDALWSQFRSESPSNIEDGVGVYVIYTEEADETLVPWYVGQTYRSFGERLKRHFERGRFSSIIDKGTLQILLIARAKNGSIIPRQSDGPEKLDKKVIDWLEVDLIEKCRRVNPKLLNRQYVLNRIWVGGYRGNGALDEQALKDYPAYHALAKLLKLDSERN